MKSLLTPLSAMLLMTACSTPAIRTVRGTPPPAPPAESTNEAPADTPVPELPPTPQAALSEAPPTQASVPTQPPATMMASSSADHEVSEMQITLRTKDGRVVSGPAPKNTAPSASLPEEYAHAPGADSMQVNPQAPASPNLAPLPRKAGAVSAEKALTWLKNGNRRFTRGHFRADGQSKKDIKRLATTAQTPHSVILACSDSRVPPELVFDQKLGEVSVIRTLGPTLDPAVIASIEHAVDKLGANLIVVMGHTSCETLADASHAIKHKTAATPWLHHVRSSLYPHLKPLSMRGPASAGHREESWANVQGIGRELGERSQIIHEGLASGTLAIHAAVYDVTHGSVEFR